MSFESFLYQDYGRWDLQIISALGLTNSKTGSGFSYGRLKLGIPLLSLNLESNVFAIACQDSPRTSHWNPNLSVCNMMVDRAMQFLTKPDAAVPSHLSVLSMNWQNI